MGTSSAGSARAGLRRCYQDFLDCWVLPFKQPVLQALKECACDAARCALRLPAGHMQAGKTEGHSPTLT